MIAEGNNFNNIICVIIGKLDIFKNKLTHFHTGQADKIVK